jgi:hypothetical protein
MVNQIGAFIFKWLAELNYRPLMDKFLPRTQRMHQATGLKRFL